MEYIKITIDIEKEKQKDRIYYLNTGKVRSSIMNFFRNPDCDTSNE